jgi:hypothetical protein
MRGRELRSDRVSALTVLALGGHDGQSHLLRERSGDEAAYAVRLPTESLHQRLWRGASRRLQYCPVIVC